MRPLYLLPVLTAFAAPAMVSAQAADPARAPIQALDDALISIMKTGQASGVRGRATSIGPVVDRSFDLPLMTRLSVGAAWTTIAPADQAALVVAFRRMTVSQYASNFNSFSGQSFKIDPKVDARGADRLVRTTLNDPKGSPVSISYRLRQSGGAWKIIDVFYRNSISQLATRRSDFATILATGGAKALVTHLNALSAKAGG